MAEPAPCRKPLVQTAGLQQQSKRWLNGSESVFCLLYVLCMLIHIICVLIHPAFPFIAFYFFLLNFFFYCFICIYRYFYVGLCGNKIYFSLKMFVTFLKSMLNGDAVRSVSYLFNSNHIISNHNHILSYLTFPDKSCRQI